MISNQVENCYARVKPGKTKQINSKSLEDAQAGVNFGSKNIGGHHVGHHVHLHVDHLGHHVGHHVTFIPATMSAM